MFPLGVTTFYHRNNSFPMFLQIRKEYIDTYTQSSQRDGCIKPNPKYTQSIFFAFKSNHDDYWKIAAKSSSHTIRLKL